MDVLYGRSEIVLDIQLLWGGRYNYYLIIYVRLFSWKPKSEVGGYSSR
jgi:hypothetical protein